MSIYGRVGAATAVRILGTNSAQEIDEHTTEGAFNDRQLLIALILVVVVLTAILVVYTMIQRRTLQARTTAQVLEEAKAKTSRSLQHGVNAADLECSQQRCWLDNSVVLSPKMVDTELPRQVYFENNMDDVDEFSFGEAVSGPTATYCMKDLAKLTAASKDEAWASLEKQDAELRQVHFDNSMDDVDEFSSGEPVLGPTATYCAKGSAMLVAGSKEDTWASLEKQKDTGSAIALAYQEPEQITDARNEISEQSDDLDELRCPCSREVVEELLFGSQKHSTSGPQACAEVLSPTNNEVLVICL